MIDIHTHLLPGVDDGVTSKEEALTLLEGYRSAGFTHIVCTPHIANPFVRTDVHAIRESYIWFEQQARDFGIEAILGSELYIGSRESRYIPFLDHFLLVETSTQVEPLFLLDRIFGFQLEGFTVILAHVERYSWFSLESKTAKRLREMGVLFQVNVQGVSNHTALPYIEKDWVDFIATDNHGPSKRAPIDPGLCNLYPEIMERSMRILEL